MKRFKKSKYEEINTFILEFINECNDHSIPINGQFVKHSAMECAKKLNIEGFKASNGWFDRLKKKYSINLVAISGESASADRNGAKNFAEGIRNLIEGYSDDEIFNLDETGLYWKAMPDKTLTRNGKLVAGRKMNKERLTIPFLVGKAGEKYEPVIIGKSDRPRALRGKDLNHLGVHYTSNTTAWVTKQFFIKYLNKINENLIKNNKRMLLLLDNCSCHKLDDFSNIKLLFLPPNTTSLIQPLDQGIIRCFKSYYKKYFMNNILSGAGIDFDTKIKSYNIFHAIQNISLAWKKVSNQTVQNCFKPLFELQKSSEVEEVLEEQKMDLDILINDMKNLKLIEEKITSEDFLTMDSKHVIVKDIIPNQLLNSKIKNYAQNFKFLGFEKDDVKNLKIKISEMKELNDNFAPHLSLNLVEYENLLNEHINKKRTLNEP